MSSRFWSESSVPARANACAATAWAIPDVHGARPAANGKSYSQTIDRPTAHGPGDERRGEMRRRRVVLRRDLRVQLREVGERVEDVAVIREEPVDGAVVALDVRVRPRERMRGEPLGVHRQGREEGQRTRRGVGAPLRGNVADNGLEQLGAEGRQALRPGLNVRERGPVPGRLGRAQVAALDGGGQTLLDQPSRRRTRGRTRDGDGEERDGGGDGCDEKGAHDDRGVSRVAAARTDYAGSTA